MNEGAPKLHTPEVVNKNEVLSTGRELTPEVLAEAIERASELVDALKQLDQTDENDNVIHLNKQEWQKAGELSAELKETLKYIPETQCLDKKNNLPFHPDDRNTKYEYPLAKFPDTPDYPVDYTHQTPGEPYPERYPRADELAEVA
ncbi:MAG: hypothetical protein ACI9SY_000560 [Candidatus Paceibacteria bacterium]|jgi:hypothetical protein